MEVGSSLFYLSERFEGEGEFTGVTISPLQAELAEARRQELIPNKKCRFLAGDFLNLPDLPQQHLGYAIEAFVHAANPEHFFQEAGKVIQAGGKLVLVDDFLSEKAESAEMLNQQARRWLKDFRAGWLAKSLISVEQLSDFAAKAGFSLAKNRNLTPYMEIGRLRDQFIGLMIRFAGPAMRRSTYFRSLTGGYAKQQCLKTGLVSYRQLILEKR